MSRTWRLAVAQMCSGAAHAENILAMQGFAAEAHAAGADALCLPEVAGCMNRHDKGPGLPVEEDPYLSACAEAARTHGLWLHSGSTPVAGPDGRKLNHCEVFDPEGNRRAVYDKIHLFDVALEGKKPIGESRRFAGGERGVVLRTPLGAWGLSICYDLRFPQLYRAYAQAGAEVLFIPSAFTVPTGRAHWAVLLRARAIETGAFVIAAAQVGKHADGRETWGHSMVVAPWGEVLLDMGREGPGLAVVEIDPGAVEQARAQIPSLTHDRDWRVEVV